MADYLAVARRALATLPGSLNTKEPETPAPKREIAERAPGEYLAKRTAGADTDVQEHLSAGLTTAEVEKTNARYARYGDDLPPSGPCYACGGIMYWRRPTGGYVCAECHPKPRWIPASKRIQ